MVLDQQFLNWNPKQQTIQFTRVLGNFVGKANAKKKAIRHQK